MMIPLLANQDLMFMLSRRLWGDHPGFPNAIGARGRSSGEKDNSVC